MSVLAVISLSFSLPSWPCAAPSRLFAIMFRMPAPHRTSSSWRASHICSPSCFHLISPSRCAFSQIAQASTWCAQCATVWCSCVSTCACCQIFLSMRLLLSLGGAGAWLLLFCFPFSVLSISSNVVALAVSMAMYVAAVADFITKSMVASLLPSSGSPRSRSFLPLTLNLVISSVREASYSSLLLAHWPTRRVSHIFCQAFT